jgi:anion-transporting  ArsA/GET3 family ATPase
MSARDIARRDLVVVTGKGGVGKSFIAAALASAFADAGRRTLLCTLDERIDAARFVGASSANFRAAEVRPHLFVSSVEPEASLKEYLKLHLHLPFVTSVTPIAAVLDFVATAAPGVREIVTVGKVAYEVREQHYDVVVVAAPATGHVAGHLAAATTLQDLVGGGLIRQQTQWMRAILQNRDRTSAVVVTSLEETPVNESIELIASLRDTADVGVDAIIANRMAPAIAPGVASEELRQMLDDSHGPDVQLARRAVERREAHLAQWHRLRAGAPQTDVVVIGEGSIDEVARALAEELSL